MRRSFSEYNGKESGFKHVSQSVHTLSSLRAAKHQHIQPLATFMLQQMYAWQRQTHTHTHTFFLLLAAVPRTAWGVSNVN